MENERIERRQLPAATLQVRQAEGVAPTITGYAVVYNTWSYTLHDWSGTPFKERFAPTAFNAWLTDQSDLVALWNHNTDMPIARRSRGTLRINNDATGLHFEIDPPQNSWGDDALVAIQRGDIGGVSFLFEATQDAWEKPGADGIAHRTVLNATLYEISPVTFPAYPATTIAVRAIVPTFKTDAQAGADILTPPQWQSLLEVRRRRLNLYRRLPTP
jgi:HK97 family phage prohead protease